MCIKIDFFLKSCSLIELLTKKKKKKKKDLRNREACGVLKVGGAVKKQNKKPKKTAQRRMRWNGKLRDVRLYWGLSSCTERRLKQDLEVEREEKQQPSGGCGPTVRTLVSITKMRLLDIQTGRGEERAQGGRCKVLEINGNKSTQL